jgi:hypothetical protein
LADAYLATGQGNEARVIAEDLVAREPWERANIERFRRALTMLGETDVDAIIADRLSGQTPFVSTDLSPGFEDETPVVASPAAQPDPSAVARALSVSQEDMLGTSPLPKSAIAASTPELPAGGTHGRIRMCSISAWPRSISGFWTSPPKVPGPQKPILRKRSRSI